jgi:regulator of sigma E protease
MFVITAGVIMNTLLAFAIFYTIALVQGKSRMETNTIGYVSKNSIADKYKIIPGDKILSINGKAVQYWDEVRSDLLVENMGENLSIRLQTPDGIKDVFIPKSELKDVSEKMIGIYPTDMVAEILQVLPGKPAGQVGLAVGDKITQFNDVKIYNSQQFVDLIKSSWDKDIKLTWLRNGKEMSGTIHPEPDSTIGVGVGKYVGTIKTINFNVITAIPEGAGDLYNYGVVLFLKSMWKIIKGDIPFSKAVGGPIKIAQYAGQSAEGGFLSFLGFMAMLSITLAIINILPFPALDGGHFTFLVYEGIFRKPVSHKVQIVVQNVGFIILMLFMAFVVYNDIIHI